MGLYQVNCPQMNWNQLLIQNQYRDDMGKTNWMMNGSFLTLNLCCFIYRHETETVHLETYCPTFFGVLTVFWTCLALQPRTLIQEFPTETVESSFGLIATILIILNACAFNVVLFLLHKKNVIPYELFFLLIQSMIHVGLFSHAFYRYRRKITS